MAYELLIAGAGPAGISCAVAVVRANPALASRILVLDRSRFPRVKPCGGGLTGHAEEAMQALGLLLSVPSFPSPRAEVRYGSLRREVKLGRPVRVVRREEFDASLVEQAKNLGIEVREETALGDFTVENGGVTAVLTRRSGESESLRVRVLVGADGAGSLVRKRLLGHRTGEATRPPLRLFRAEIAATVSDPVSDAMLYDFTPMRDGLRGYLWVFPVPGGRKNVGLMHYPNPHTPLSGGELAELCRTHLAEKGITVGKSELRGWPAWGYRPGAEVAAPHVLVVGDAAGIDALTGEGIAVGMEHGLIAGAFITRALKTGDCDFSGYTKALRRSTVGRELELDRRLAFLLYDGKKRSYARWLSLVLFDEELLELYAARVSGTVILSNRKLALFRSLMSHLFLSRARLLRLLACEKSR